MPAAKGSARTPLGPKNFMRYSETDEIRNIGQPPFCSDIGISPPNQCESGRFNPHKLLGHILPHLSYVDSFNYSLLFSRKAIEATNHICPG